MQDYLNHKKRVGDDKISRQKEQKEDEEERQKEKGKKIAAIPRVLAKAEAIKKELNTPNKSYF